jgi:hypothetical protein
VVIVIGRDGRVRATADTAAQLSPEFVQTGERRASHIVPCDPVLRIAFKVLRRACGDRGRVGAWTRRWNVDWAVDLRPSGGPVIEPFADRHEALLHEVEWLIENWLPRGA